MLVGTGPVCFDTMILSTFVQVNRRQILTACMGTRARITTGVDRELKYRAKHNADIHLVRPASGFGLEAKLDHDAMKRVSDQQRAWHGREVLETESGMDR